MHTGWVKYHRKSLTNPLFRSPFVWHFWNYCLLKASHTAREVFFNGSVVRLEPGQFVFGRAVAAHETGLSEQQIRTTGQILKKFKMLTIQPTNRFSIISIINWDSYQQKDSEVNQQTNQPNPSQQPAKPHIQERNKNEKKNNTFPQNADPHQSEDVGEDFYLTKKRRKLAGKRLEAFEKFWIAFAYKKDRASAADAWLDIPSLTETLANTICEAAKKEAASRPDKIAKGRTPIYAQGWLSARRWEDEGLSAPSIPAILPEDEILKKYGIS